MRGTLLLLLLAVAGALATENVLHLTAEDFDEAVQEHAFLVVKFFAKWCSHCQKLTPEWEQAATTLKDDTTAITYGITLAAVDATVHASLAKKFGVQGFPTIKIFEGHSAVLVPHHQRSGYANLERRAWYHHDAQGFRGD